MPSWEQISLAAYACVGPLTWAGLWAGMLLGRSRMNRLAGRAPNLPEIAPVVTILVPAKDEAAGIRACVEGLLKQDYPSFDVLIVDDRSTDGTGEILDEMACDEETPGRSLKISHIEKKALPTGWLGKCHALHVGTRSVATPWILFVDSDVTLEPNALREAMGLALARGYDALSLLTRLKGRTFWERLMIPVAAGAWAVMFKISLTNNDNRPEDAYANGQFLLVRREVYERAGNHEAVKGEIVEDCALMQKMKATGAKVRLMTGGRLAATTMHATLAELKSGWGRIYAGTNHYGRGKLLAGIGFTIICGISVYPALVWGLVDLKRSSSATWLVLAVLHFLLLTSFVASVYQWAQGKARLALLWPVSSIVLIRLLFEGVKRCGSRTIEWRGTMFSAEMSRKT